MTGSLLTSRKKALSERRVIHSTDKGQQNVYQLQQHFGRYRVKQACLWWRSEDNFAQFVLSTILERRQLFPGVN